MQFPHWWELYLRIFYIYSKKFQWKKGFGNTLDEINLFYIVKGLQELFTEE